MTVTVLQLSDIHIADAPGGLVSGFAPEPRLDAVVAAWQALGRDADLLLLTGDNTDAGGASAYARLSMGLQPLELPVLALPGNHDDPVVMARTFAETSVAELGEWRIVCVDSSRPRQIHGTVDVAEVLEQLDAMDVRPTLVAIHHPPRSRSTHPYFQLEGAADLLAGLAERPHVKAVVSGHLHEAFEADGPGALRLMGCPSTLMAIGHDGGSYQVGTDAPTGGRIIELHDDGTITSTLLVA